MVDAATEWIVASMTHEEILGRFAERHCPSEPMRKYRPIRQPESAIAPIARPSSPDNAWPEFWPVSGSFANTQKSREPKCRIHRWTADHVGSQKADCGRLHGPADWATTETDALAESIASIRAPTRRVLRSTGSRCPLLLDVAFQCTCPRFREGMMPRRTPAQEW